MTHKEFLTQLVPSKLDRLHPHQMPQWGKMTPQHMIEHLEQTLLVSTITALTPPRPLTPLQIETKKLLLISDEPLPHNLQNPIFRFGLPAYSHPDLEVAKQKMVEKIRRFYEVYHRQPNSTSFFSFFGDLNFEEIERFHRKHFTHHFTQFGLL